jgi:hypothetical protein
VVYPGRTVVAILICAETKKKKHHSSFGRYQVESTKKLINLKEKERMEGEHMGIIQALHNHHAILGSENLCTG